MSPEEPRERSCVHSPFQVCVHTVPTCRGSEVTTPVHPQPGAGLSMRLGQPRTCSGSATRGLRSFAESLVKGTPWSLEGRRDVESSSWPPACIPVGSVENGTRPSQEVPEGVAYGGEGSVQWLWRWRLGSQGRPGWNHGHRIACWGQDKRTRSRMRSWLSRVMTQMAGAERGKGQPRNHTPRGRKRPNSWLSLWPRTVEDLGTLQHPFSFLRRMASGSPFGEQ